MLTQTVAFLAAAAIAAPGIARFSERSFEDFETCYGSYEGASSVLPILKDSMPPDDAAAVQHAMDNLGSDFMDLEKRLFDVVRTADRDTLREAHLIGRIPWTKPESQTLAFWSRNAPMSIACFALTKRLHEELPPAF